MKSTGIITIGLTVIRHSSSKTLIGVWGAFNNYLEFYLQLPITQSSQCWSWEYNHVRIYESHGIHPRPLSLLEAEAKVLLFYRSYFHHSFLLLSHIWI